MDVKLIDKFSYLPFELVNMIINYTDVVVFRHGKYIDRINKSDKRRNIIEKIARPIKVGPDKILLKLINYKDCDILGYLLEYNFNGTLTKLRIKFVVREIDGFDRYYDIKSDNLYIFDANNRWYKLIHYIN